MIKYKKQSFSKNRGFNSIKNALNYYRTIHNFTAVIIGLTAWVIIILIKDPKNVFKKSKIK